MPSNFDNLTAWPEVQLSAKEPTIHPPRPEVVLHHGRYELRGGTPGDHTAAREWASMFMHGALHQLGGMRRQEPPAAR